MTTPADNTEINLTTSMQLETPLLFLVFNRPDTTQIVFDRIREAAPKRLFVAADGPRPHVPADSKKCSMVRKIIEKVDWDCEVKTLFRTENLGCGKAVSSAITWFFDEVEQGIILEDDCLPDLSFFGFCTTLLERYKDDEEVMHISGDNFQFGRSITEASYYFSAYAHVWGWASWRRAWKNFDLQMDGVEMFFEKKGHLKYTNSKSEERYWRSTFNKVLAHQVDSWAFPWSFSVWNSNGICILPNVNLVSNIGFGGDATHTSDDFGLGNIPSHSISTIIHPENNKLNREADALSFRRAFKPKLSTKIFRKLNSILK